MLQMITSNISTILVSLVLLCITIAIIKKIYHDKKTGNHCCSKGCSCCSSNCHDTKSTLVEQYKSDIEGV